MINRNLFTWTLGVMSVLLCLALVGCGGSEAGKDKAPDLVMFGTIGKKLASHFELHQSGDKFKGVFFYDEDKENRIPVEGVIANGTLRLEEFNNESNKLTGIFEGAWDGKVYKGFWQDPAGKDKVPFRYENRTPESKSGKDTSPERTPKERIAAAYTDWVAAKVKANEYWTEEKWDSYRDSFGDKDIYADDTYLDNCKDGLPPTIDPYYGDINQDGILDAYAAVRPSFCMGGNWSRWVHVDLFLISNADGSYDALADPKSFGGAIGIGFVDSIASNGEILCEGRDYTEEDPMCCPSKEWKVRYVWDGGKFREKK